MNIVELKERLNEEKIPSNWYSINGYLASDIFVLQNVGDYWETFYIDERGNQDNDYRRFDNENDACIFFLNRLIEEKG